jgi:hypothetical protein
MNALTQLHQTESRLVASIEAAARAVDDIGTDHLGAALAGLEAAVGRARERLDTALGHMQAVVAGLASDYEAAALSVEADVCPTAEPIGNPPVVAQEPPAAVEATNVPATSTTRQTATQEPETASAEQRVEALVSAVLGGDVGEVERLTTGKTEEPAANGTDDGQADPGHLAAAAIGVKPAANGHAKGHGRRRKTK